MVTYVIKSKFEGWYVYVWLYWFYVAVIVYCMLIYVNLLSCAFCYILYNAIVYI